MAKKLVFAAAITGFLLMGATVVKIANPQGSPPANTRANATDTLLVQNTASASTQALATHLQQIGAKMYGAYWCPYCTRQQEMFGSAISQINYIECDPKGQNPQPALCEKAGISGFPTWEINGKLYPGMQTLQELATLSGYRGSTNF